MGQKVNPHGLRVGVIKNWDSRWFAEKGTFGDTLVEDYNVRNFILKELNTRSKNPADKCVYAGVPKVEIERFADKDGGQKVRIHIHCAKPGIVIGRGGAEIEKLRANVEKMIGKSVAINIVEVKQPDINAQLVAEKIAHDLEDRISFRRAMKQSIGRAMKLGAKGIKVRCGGRLGGAEIARAETYHEGDNPLQTIRATSTMVQLRHTQLTVGSALRYGYTEARFLRAKLLLQTRESQTTEDARTEMVSVTSIRLKKREVTSNAASKES